MVLLVYMHLGFGAIRGFSSLRATYNNRPKGRKRLEKGFINKECELISQSRAAMQPTTTTTDAAGNDEKPRIDYLVPRHMPRHRPPAAPLETAAATVVWPPLFCFCGWLAAGCDPPAGRHRRRMHRGCGRDESPPPNAIINDCTNQSLQQAFSPGISFPPASDAQRPAS